MRVPELPDVWNGYAARYMSQVPNVAGCASLQDEILHYGGLGAVKSKFPACSGAGHIKAAPYVMPLLNQGVRRRCKHCRSSWDQARALAW